MKAPIYLGVNVDHVATVRQARGTSYPDPVHAALQAEHAGADGITMHLREDRRHIQDHDVYRYSELKQTKLNFECAATEEMMRIALEIQPEDMCLVPENRQEVTTEGGLDVLSNHDQLLEYCSELNRQKIVAALFIDPDENQIEAAAKVGAAAIELHTGVYADAESPVVQKEELEKIKRATEFAYSLGILVNAGHGLHFQNVAPIAAIDMINELNIGHSLIAKAIFDGLPKVVSDMKSAMQAARHQ